MNRLTTFAICKLVATTVGAAAAAGFAVKKGVEYLNPGKNIKAIKDAIASADDFDDEDDDDDLEDFEDGGDIETMMASQNSAVSADPAQA